MSRHITGLRTARTRLCSRSGTCSSCTAEAPWPLSRNIRVNLVAPLLVPHCNDLPRSPGRPRPRPSSVLAAPPRGCHVPLKASTDVQGQPLSYCQPITQHALLYSLFGRLDCPLSSLPRCWPTASLPAWITPSFLVLDAISPQSWQLDFLCCLLPNTPRLLPIQWARPACSPGPAHSDPSCCSPSMTTTCVWNLILGRTSDTSPWGELRLRGDWEILSSRGD